MPKKVTELEAIRRDQELHIHRLELYKGYDKLTSYLCPKCLKPFNTRPHDVWAGKVAKCNQCRLDNQGGYNLLSEEEATAKDKQSGWERLTVYINNYTKAEYICPRCGNKFWIRPDSVWTGNAKSCGCIQKGQPAHNRKNRTGDKHNSLTAIRFLRTERKDNDHQPIWLWQCDCGRTTESDGYAVESGNTKTCGHCTDPILNQQFLELIVTKVEPQKGGGCTCECLCSCGKTWRGYGSVLTHGNTTSCGHCQDPIVGLRNGRLVVSEVYPSSGGGSSCKCICDCGGIWTGVSSQMPLSCGCLMSSGEEQISIILHELNVQFEQQYTSDTCINPTTKRKLRFDFYVPSVNICIEYNGPQHYIKEYHDQCFPNDTNNFEKLQIRDQIKRDYCAANGIRLLEIPYTDYGRIEEILRRELDIS